jgi:hypothetical protein
MDVLCNNFIETLPFKALLCTNSHTFTASIPLIGVDVLFRNSLPMIQNPSYKAIPEPKEGFKSLGEFYPFYLGEHRNKINRRIHLISTTGVILLALYAVIKQKLGLLKFIPLVGYGGAWIGHFWFEKNRPATFRYPFYSLASDFILWYQVFSMKRPF